MRFDDELRLRLSENLARFGRRCLAAGERQTAAVAVVIVPDEEERASVVLTVRARGLKRHGGQWACPGGRRDPGETAEAAALRELAEEVALDLPPERVLGCLDDYATRSGFVITPVVVWGRSEAELRPDPREVASIHLLPIAELTPDKVVLQTIAQSDRPVMALAILGSLLYAPTAAILHQFAEVAVHGRDTRVGHFDQPLFAWR